MTPNPGGISIHRVGIAMLTADLDSRRNKAASNIVAAGISRLIPDKRTNQAKKRGTEKVPLFLITAEPENLPL